MPWHKWLNDARLTVTVSAIDWISVDLKLEVRLYILHVSSYSKVFHEFFVSL